MDKKELIKLYLQNVDKMFGYANMDTYIDERLKKYMKYCQSEEPLLLLNDFEKIDLPIMYLTAGKKRLLDIENYRQEAVKKIQALHYDQSSWS
ncbi:hypothetical protein [Longicatena caecimuris]|uniref:Uncharacterized protein n=1 Tax=Longicatena caecimuris TaxID=1796635 RepID=A0A4R3TDM4_9FIRM|nr:hypothetical protein [Longicatena caecimuris]MCR1870138.1 hypothetical protein [Longicatena caecimuris]MCU0102655.1 hypothetical protein [Longicatena caecimuris]TCU60063.1 hypothetical protein EDD61_109102 [Longicatena caecimuris]